MSAETLRAAAKLLRERAEAATRPEAMHPWGDKSLPALPASAHPTEVEGYLGGSWGTYYATVHPGVGLALADWLDATAKSIDWAPEFGIDVEADALARLIVGDES